jgi:hypothetical protein
VLQRPEAVHFKAVRGLCASADRPGSSAAVENPLLLCDSGRLEQRQWPRRGAWLRTGGQAQVREDPHDHDRIFDRGEDLPGTATRSVLNAKDAMLANDRIGSDAVERLICRCRNSKKMQKAYFNPLVQKSRLRGDGKESASGLRISEFFNGIGRLLTVDPSGQRSFNSGRADVRRSEAS